MRLQLYRFSFFFLSFFFLWVRCCDCESLIQLVSHGDRESLATIQRRTSRSRHTVVCARPSRRRPLVAAECRNPLRFFCSSSQQAKWPLRRAITHWLRRRQDYKRVPRARGRQDSRSHVPEIKQHQNQKDNQQHPDANHLLFTLFVLSLCLPHAHARMSLWPCGTTPRTQNI